MKNTKIVKAKSPPGLKMMPAKNTISHKLVSTFIQKIRSIRLMKNQWQLSSRHALARHELSGLSRHILEDIGIIGDVFQNGDITNSPKSFISKSFLKNNDAPSQLQRLCNKTSIGYVDFSNEIITLKKVA